MCQPKRALPQRAVTRDEVAALAELYAQISNELHQDNLIHKDEFMWALFKANRDNLFAERVRLLAAGRDGKGGPCQGGWQPRTAEASQRGCCTRRAGCRADRRKAGAACCVTFCSPLRTRINLHRLRGIQAFSGRQASALGPPSW